MSSVTDTTDTTNTTEVTSVTIFDECLKSLPCKHKVTIYYADNTSQELILSSKIIAEKYWSYASADLKNHIKSHS